MVQKYLENESRDNLIMLSKRGWKMLSPVDLHHFRPMPEPEPPFLPMFMTMGFGDGKRKRYESRGRTAPGYSYLVQMAKLRPLQKENIEQVHGDIPIEQVHGDDGGKVNWNFPHSLSGHFVAGVRCHLYINPKWWDLFFSVNWSRARALSIGAIFTWLDSWDFENSKSQVVFLQTAIFRTIAVIEN